MPATSRSGESGSAALVERLRRLALEVEQHPAVRRCAGPGRGVVAVDALHAHRLAGARRASRTPSRSAGVRTASSGTVGGRVVEPLPASPRPACVERVARQRRRWPSAWARSRVHLGGRRAEPLGLAGEVAADLVGVQVALGEQVADAGLARAPSRRSPLAGTPAACRGAVRRLPATVPALAHEPAERARDVPADPDGQRAASSRGRG